MVDGRVKQLIVDRRLHKKLKEIAAREEKKLKELVEKILWDWVKKYEEQGIKRRRR